MTRAGWPPSEDLDALDRGPGEALARVHEQHRRRFAYRRGLALVDEFASQARRPVPPPEPRPRHLSSVPAGDQR